MASKDSTFLIDSPIGCHFAQLYRETQSLVESVSLFIEAGLRRGNGAVVIAPFNQIEQFLVHLRRNGLEPEPYRTYGQLCLINADEILNQYMRDRTFDLEGFKQETRNILESVLRFGRSDTRVYGEMVNILWQQGDTQTAIKLEEHWNDLAQLYPLSIFCGYMVDSHLEESYARPLHEIGRTHSDLIATHEDERFQIALDLATKEIIGIPLNEMLNLPDKEALPGEQSLPSGQRAMLWIRRYMPESSAKVLKSARHFYAMKT